jgi:hypothetical protein
MTFLDLVREVGELTRDRCDPECSLPMHRMEAARYMGILLDHPYLLEALKEISDRQAAKPCTHPDNYFDRTVCPPPCEMMHTRCSSCQQPLEECRWESIPESMRQRVDFYDGPECQHNDGTCQPYVDE